jgi:hypothetical protein
MSDRRKCVCAACACCVSRSVGTDPIQTATAPAHRAAGPCSAASHRHRLWQTLSHGLAHRWRPCRCGWRTYQPAAVTLTTGRSPPPARTHSTTRTHAAANTSVPHTRHEAGTHCTRSVCAPSPAFTQTSAHAPAHTPADTPAASEVFVTQDGFRYKRRKREAEPQARAAASRALSPARQGHSRFRMPLTLRPRLRHPQSRLCPRRSHTRSLACTRCTRRCRQVCRRLSGFDCCWTQSPK